MTGFPTREEVVKVVQDKLEKGYGRYILIVEYHKVSNKLGVIKGELIQNSNVIFKGKMTQFPAVQEEGFNWNILKKGDSYFEAYSLDYKGQNIIGLITEGLKKSIGEGKIPFIR